MIQNWLLNYNITEMAQLSVIIGWEYPLILIIKPSKSLGSLGFPGHLGCKERDDIDDDVVFIVGEPGEVVYDGAKEIKKEIKKARGGSVKVVTRKGEKLGKGVHPMVSDRAREADEAAAGKPQIKESQLLTDAATKVEEPDTMIRRKKIGDHARVKLPPSVSDKAFDDEFRRGAAIDHAKHAAGEAGSAIGNKLEEAKNVAGEKAESIKSDVKEGAHDFASESERKAEKIKSGAVDAARGAKEGVEYAGQAVADTAGHVKDAAVDTAVGVKEGVEHAGEAVADTAKGAVDAAGQIGTGIQKAASGVWNSAGRAVDAVGSGVVDVAVGIKNVAGSAVDAVGDAAFAVGTVGGAKAVGSGISTVVSGAGEKVGEGVESVGHGIAGVGENIKEKAHD
ncbi:unnamed protein product [Gongylonema pulchrum]|uniref:Late embryogenesis abundant protein n=1 Tax=Gongylonema pulchrum TaxID=637853 RepID=A0A183E212_9BILA|nr:unnamed protein product [Gongylonema pulchrum]